MDITQNISGNVSTRESLRKLTGYLNDLNTAKLAVRKKEEILACVQQLYSDLREIIFNGSYEMDLPRKTFIDTVVAIAEQELNSNLSKGGVLKKQIQKDDGFQLFRKVINDLTEVGRVEIVDDLDIDLFGPLLRLLNHPVIEEKSYLAEMIVNLMHRYLTRIDISTLISGENLKDLWLLLWRHYSNLTDSKTAVSYLQLVVIILRAIPETNLCLESQKLVENMLDWMHRRSDSLKLYSSHGMLTASTEILMVTLELFGMEYRDSLLAKLLPILPEYISRMSVDWTSSFSKEFHEYSWRFANHYFSLVMGQNCTDFFEKSVPTAVECLQKLIKELVSVSCSRPNFVLTEFKAELISRLLVISEMSSSVDATVNITLNTTFQAKRRKEMSVMSILCDWDFDASLDLSSRPLLAVSCMNIIKKAVDLWGEVLGPEKLISIAESTWSHHSDLLEPQRASFCALLSAIVRRETFKKSLKTCEFSSSPSLQSMETETDPKNLLRDMWRYTVASTQITSSANEALQLIIELLKMHREPLISIFTEKSIIESIVLVIKRCHSNGPEILTLISFLICHMEFDERSSFSNSSESRTIPDWRFRCELIDFLVTSAHYDLSSILFQLTSFHPQTIEIEEKDQENDEWFKIFNKKRSSTANEKKTGKATVSLIPEMVQYISDILLGCWNTVNNSHRVELWKTIFRFTHIISNNDTSMLSILNPLLTAGNNWLQYAAEHESSEILAQLDIGYACILVSEEVLPYLRAAADRCPQLFARFLHTEQDIPTEHFTTHVEEITRLLSIENFVVYASKWLVKVQGIQGLPKLADVLGQRIVIFCQSHDYLPDMLLLLKKAGPYLPDWARETVIERAKDILEEDSRSQSKQEFAFSCKRLVETDILSLNPDLPKKRIDSNLANIASPLAVTRAALLLHIELDAFEILLKATKDNSILRKHIVQSILENGMTWKIHENVLLKVLTEGDFELDSDNSWLQKYVKFFSISLAKLLNQRRMQLPQNSPLSRYLNVDLFIDNRPFTIDSFPRAFYLNIENWSVVSQIFWKLYSRHSHKLLTELRFLVDEHSELGLEIRLLEFLKHLTYSMPNIEEKMQTPFALTVTTVSLALLEKIKSRCDPEELSAFQNLATEIDQILAGKGCRLPYSISWFPADFMEIDTEENSQQLSGDVRKFLAGSWSLEVSALFTRKFWLNLTEVLKNNKSSLLGRLKPLQQDVICLIWELVPELRSYISPVLPYLISSEYDLIRLPDYSTEQFIQSLKLFCKMNLLNFWPSCDRKTFETAIRLYSGEVLSNANFLSKPNLLPNQPTKKINDISSKFCAGILEEISGENRELSSLFGEIRHFTPAQPILARIVAPFLCNLPEVKAKAANCLLDFVSDFSEEYDNRFARMICECIDSIGLGIFASMDSEFDSFLALGQIAIKAKCYDHAYAMTNLAFDRLVENSRNLAGVGGSIPEDSRLIDLLREIYVNKKDVASSGSLPLWAQSDGRIHLLSLVESSRWLDVFRSTFATEEEKSFAAWYCNISDAFKSGESKYIDSLLFGNMEISFPKRMKAHWERLYAAVYVGEKSPQTTETIWKNLYQDLASSEDISVSLCSDAQDFIAIQKARDHEFQLENLSIRQLALINSDCLRLMAQKKMIDNREKQKFRRLIFTLIDRLLIKKAYGAGLSIIEKAIEVTDSEIKAELMVKKCEIRAAMGDIVLAKHELAQLRKSIGISAVSIKALCLQAKLSSEYSKNLAEAMTFINETEQFPSEIKTLECLELVFSLKFRNLTELEARKVSPNNLQRNKALVAWKEELKRRDGDMKQASIINREFTSEYSVVQELSNKIIRAAHSSVEAGLNLLDRICQENAHLPITDEFITKTNRIIFPLIDVIFRYENETTVANAFDTYVRQKMMVLPAIWVPIVPHIVAQCFGGATQLTATVRQMIVNLIVCYPYHVAMTLLSYKYDKQSLTKNANVVNNLLDAAKRKAPALKNILIDLSIAHDVYREFLWLPIKKHNIHPMFQPVKSLGGEKYILSRDLGFFKQIEVLRRIPLPTVDQPIGRAGDYTRNGLILWQNLDESCTKADGQSAPKILKAQGNDGNWYKVVWKDGESLRQDSLVQDIFRMMSGLISSERPLRTYNVLPVDYLSGIIEFCDGTTPFKELLIGADSRSGLHAEIHPNEDIYAIRSKMAQLMNEKNAITEEQFVEILKKCTPVFRHYFYRTFPSCREWNQKIENYTVSLAQWSIVCYIIGLGDRHCSNVLFEHVSCRFVHIDLGMIMEYSKRILPVPELVPFRLTRDILDPILIQGTRGKLATEATRVFELMRQNKQVLRGIASVFLRETVATHRDSRDESQPSHISKAAIGRLEDKLNATDFSTSPLSSDCQVELLFSEATNLTNLHRMFHGWLPFI